MRGEPSNLFTPFGAKIAYACIFQPTVDEAASNLIRLILRGECGFDEDATAWRTAIREYQVSEHLVELNTLGASFTVSDWRQILRTVLDALSDG